MIAFRHASIAAALLAGTGVANAQTTVITREPVETRTVVTTEPLQLTPVQRQTIYRTVIHRRVAPPPPPTVEYRVGTPVRDVQLYAMPDDVGVEVPAVRTYKYMVVNDRVVLVDPATSQVVAEIGE